VLGEEVKWRLSQEQEQKQQPAARHRWLKRALVRCAFSHPVAHSPLASSSSLEDEALLHAFCVEQLRSSSVLRLLSLQSASPWLFLQLLLLLMLTLLLLLVWSCLLVVGSKKQKTKTPTMQQQQQQQLKCCNQNWIHENAVEVEVAVLLRKQTAVHLPEKGRHRYCRYCHRHHSHYNCTHHTLHRQYHSQSSAVAVVAVGGGGRAPLRPSIPVHTCEKENKEDKNRKP
jgi:hypothetical protein